jgi:hypothetical protein
VQVLSKRKVYQILEKGSAKRQESSHTDERYVPHCVHHLYEGEQLQGGSGGGRGRIRGNMNLLYQSGLYKYKSLNYSKENLL